MLALHRVGRFSAVLLLAAGLVAGCSSSGRVKEGSKAIEGFEKTRTELQKGQKEVDQSLAALNALSAGGELRKSYGKFCDEVDDLQEAQQHAAKRAESMRDNMQAYVSKWQAEVSEMNDPTIKASLDQRRAAVSAKFDRVRAGAQPTRQAYDAYMAQLQEIRKALAVDLSPAALPGLKPAMDKARAQGQTLKQNLASMQRELDDMLKGISASGSASAAR